MQVCIALLPPIASFTRKNHSGRGLGNLLTFHPYIYNRIPAAFRHRHAFPLHLSLCLNLPKVCLCRWTPRTKYSQTPRLCMHYTGCRFPPLPSHLPSPLLSSSGAPRRGDRCGRGRRCVYRMRRRLRMLRVRCRSRGKSP